MTSQDGGRTDAHRDGYDDGREDLSYAELRERLAREWAFPPSLTSAARRALLEAALEISRSVKAEVELVAYSAMRAGDPEVSAESVAKGVANFHAKSAQQGAVEFAEAEAQRQTYLAVRNRRLGVWGTIVMTVGGAGMLLAPMVHDTEALAIGTTGFIVQMVGLTLLNRRRV